MDKKAIALYKMCEDGKFFGNILAKFAKIYKVTETLFQKTYQIIIKKPDFECRLKLLTVIKLMC